MSKLMCEKTKHHHAKHRRLKLSSGDVKSCKCLQINIHLYLEIHKTSGTAATSWESTDNKRKKLFLQHK